LFLFFQRSKGTTAVDIVVNTKLPSMSLNSPFRNRQTKRDAGGFAGSRVICEIKAVEYLAPGGIAPSRSTISTNTSAEIRRTNRGKLVIGEDLDVH